ncbi:MAG: hypothetical protein M1839_002449 [Geoglossum umbratile]|nr:MAG: hypothetical protein M1839_002449 [Geoglossum umbratile]
MSSSNPGKPIPADPAAAASDQPALEVDPQSIGDGDYGDEMNSYTTSLKSSITDYQYENGRRYHAFRAGSYPLPNDDREAERLDIFHHAMTLSLGGKLHLAPVGEHPMRVLDIGTGTGIWAIQMGDEYPSADILGVDLSPTQPTFIPLNVSFEVDDVESPWTFSAPFDYIHCRYMSASIGDWPRLFSQTFKHLKPGGWAEFHDFDFHFYSDDKSVETKGEKIVAWCDKILEGYDKLGRESTPGPKLEGWAKEAGFENITNKVLKYPMGIWPKDKNYKEQGAFNYLQLMNGFEGLSLASLTRAYNMSPADVYEFIAEARNDLKRPDLHILYNG